MRSIPKPDLEHARALAAGAGLPAIELMDERTLLALMLKRASLPTNPHRLAGDLLDRFGARPRLSQRTHQSWPVRPAWTSPPSRTSSCCDRFAFI